MNNKIISENSESSVSNPRWTKRIVWIVLIVCLVSLGGWIGYVNLLAKQHYPVSEERNHVADAESGKETMTEKNTNETVESKTPKREYHCQIIYSPGYVINLGGLERMHPFDIRKYEKIHNQLLEDGLLTDEQTLKPAPLTTEDLELIHSPAYLEKLKSRTNVARYLEAEALRFAPVSLDKAVLKPFRRASGGTLLAARKSLDTGIGINIGGGYHHAKPHTGEGFCVYADVPIAIRKLQVEKLIERAVIIDVDVHQGNGTAICLANDDSTFTCSIHQGDIYPIPKESSDLDLEVDSGMNDDEYLTLLVEQLPEIFAEANADICFIVGGCDTLSGDPLASLAMTPEGIVQRDEMIVAACVERNMPVVLTLSGGYSPDAWKAQYMSIRNLIEKYPLPQDDQE